MSISNSKLLKAAAGIAAAGVLALSVASLAGCQAKQVAATVNGTEIPEQQITDYVQDFRASNDKLDNGKWAQWLVDSNRTPSEVREDAINYYVEQILIDQAAKNEGVTASDSEVEARLAETREYYGMDEAQFAEQIKAMGYTQESYTALQRQSVLQEKITAKLNAANGNNGGQVSDQDIISMANSYASILNGAKHLKVIAVDSVDDANKALAEVHGGADFNSIAAKYTKTDEYDGWDVVTTEEQVVIDATTEMGRNDVSDVVQGADHVYVVKVDDILVVPANPENEYAPYTSIDQIPQDLRAEFAESASASNQSNVFSSYLDKLCGEANIVINEMPKGLPYDVSLEGLTPASNASADVDADYDEDVVDRNAGGIATQVEETATSVENAGANAAVEPPASRPATQDASQESADAGSTAPAQDGQQSGSGASFTPTTSVDLSGQNNNNNNNGQLQGGQQN